LARDNEGKAGSRAHAGQATSGRRPRAESAGGRGVPCAGACPGPSPIGKTCSGDTTALASVGSLGGQAFPARCAPSGGQARS